MAVAVEPDQDLLAQAGELERRADELYEEVGTLRRQAAELRLEATAEQRHVEIKNGLPIPQALLDEVWKAVSECEPCTAREVAMRLGLSRQQVERRLIRLKAAKRVYQTGQRNSSRWSAIAEGEIPPVRQTAEQKVRDALVKLGAATVQELASESGAGRQAVIYWLKKFEEAELVTKVRVGKADLYEFVRPKGENKARPRKETPEAEAVRLHGRIVTRRGQQARTKRYRSGNTLVNDVIREAGALGVEITTSKHRVEYRVDGKVVAHSSRTPGAATSMAKTRRELRAAGVMVKA